MKYNKYYYISEEANAKEWVKSIQMMEKDYDGDYLGSVNLLSRFSIKLNFLGFSLGKQRINMFKIGKRVNKKCGKCGYPAKKSFLLDFGECKKCRSCHNNIYLNDKYINEKI